MGRESRYDYAKRAISELVGLHRLDCFGVVAPNHGVS